MLGGSLQEKNNVNADIRRERTFFNFLYLAAGRLMVGPSESEAGESRD